MKKLFATLTIAGLAVLPAPAQLLIDFNSTTQDGGPHNEPGYQPYNAGHEISADFITRTYAVNFALTGAANVSLTPDWPNTADARVEQMIDRSATANDVNWVGNNLNLLTDFLGSDSRTGGGGNGDFDGINGTPTWLTITLGGLPGGAYDWTSFHHDTEHMNSFFTIELSTDAGATFAQVFSGRMTDSTPGGSPDSLNPISGALDPDPHNLSSTARFGFTADGNDDVVLRFTPLAQLLVHQQFFGINGFELVQVPEPSTLGLLGVGAAALVLLRRRK